MRISIELSKMEMNIFKMFESVCNAEIVQKGDTFIVTDTLDGDCVITSGSFGKILLFAVESISEYIEDVNYYNSNYSLESVGDYLPMLLSLDYDTTIVPIGNGYMSAPSTITAKHQTSYNGYSVLAIYDYEENEAETIKSLNEFFPTTPPMYAVTFEYKNNAYDYVSLVEAVSEKEAVKKAMTIFEQDCDWDWMPFKSIKVEELDSFDELLNETLEEVGAAND